MAQLRYSGRGCALRGHSTPNATAMGRLRAPGCGTLNEYESLEDNPARVGPMMLGLQFDTDVMLTACAQSPPPWHAW